MGLMEIIKSVAKEDADFSAIEGQLSGYVNLSELPKEQGFETIKSYPSLLSAFDSEVSRSVNTGVENFKNKGMLDILKEKEASIRAEINPQESESDKKLREAMDRIDSMERKEKLGLLQDELSNKAKELNFDPIKARDYASFGDNAMQKLQTDIEWFNKELESQLSSAIKNKYNTEQPKSVPVKLDDIDSRIRKARSEGNTDLALKLQMMKDAQKN